MSFEMWSLLTPKRLFIKRIYLQQIQNSCLYLKPVWLRLVQKINSLILTFPFSL